MDLNETRVCSSLDQDVDHVSNLPDAILCHILSYLPTKYSVRTRILSTRWKYLFTLVPVLEFYSPSHCLAWTTVKPFLDFVNFVLSSYNVDCMDRFHYFSSSFLPESEAPRLVSWIHDSVNRRVRELIINEDLNTPVTFPCNTFLSQSLAVLKIMGRFNLDVPENVFLPRLKTFHLLSVVFNDDYSVRRLFQSCPVLKVLVLEYCSSKNINVIEICVPSLVKLKISGFKDEFALVLDVPNVKYFEYRGSESQGFSVRCGLKSLVNACVSFPTWSDAGFEALPKLVSIVSHVRRLKICASTLEAFRGFGHTLPTFHNLTNLEMKISTVLGFDQRILIDFLDKAPRLDVLVLDGGCSSEFEPSDKVPEHVPTCVSTHLKLIEFQGVSMLVYERTLVEYFLKNARVLEIFYIQLKGSLEKQFEMNKKLLTISRCSKACQIFVDSVDDGSR